MKIRAQAYDFPPEDIDFVTSEFRKLLEDRGFLTMGRYAERFEKAFAERHGSRFGVATSSGTAALEAILRSLEVEGGEVVVPTNTFAATAFAVIGAGARPVFADIREDLTVDPADVADCIGADTRAVLTVHIGGLVSPATLDLEHLCRDRGVPLVEDAAHAHGSALNGRAAGTFGIAGAFSFFSTKVITTGEGGMVVTDDARINETVRLLRDQAKLDGSNLHERTGYNWRPTEIQAIIGLAQLRRLDDFIARRREIAALYDRGLEDVAGARPLPVPRHATHSFYKYVVILEQGDPEILKEEMKRDFDISLGGYVYDVPLHQQPAFKEYATDPLPRAEDLCRRHVCPPIYPSLTNDEVEYVVDALRQKLAAAAQRKESA